LVGELAHASVPDLKEAYGGLRDATVLKALVATWLVDVPHVELERSRRVLLDVRDELHALTGRPHDRIAGELWPDLAQRLGHPDALAAQRAVRLHGRRITHLSRLTWRRVDAALGRTVASSKRQRPGPSMTPIAPGVAVAGGEVVLEAKVRPGDDPTLLLRLAAVASERDLPLNPAAVARLVQEGTRLPDPWPDEARDQFVRLLAGPGLIAVWETLDETGAVDSFLPDWERIRLLPHASQIHRFTVDRHVVETCAEAARLIRQVARPDVLLVAALLHDIGKGELTEHCAAGEPIARRASTRMGFSAADVERIALLVRHHLLLADLATTRDPDDPATLAALAEAVPDVETLSLLAALTEADARATSPQAWSTWRASLIRKLAAQAAGHLVAPGMRSTATVSLQVPAAVRIDPAYVDLDLVAVPGGTRITVVAQDRLGLMADVAACLALQRTSVRAVRAWSQGDIAVSRWEVADDHLDARMLRQRIEALRAGTLDVRARLRDNSTVGLPPTVAVTSNASSDSTVLEVRAQDRPAVLFTVLDVLAQIGVSVRSAHVDTLGPQAVDVFYLQEESAGALSEERAVRAAAVVRRALGG
jgi:[protein-PII] uridylyltransferase